MEVFRVEDYAGYGPFGNANDEIYPNEWGNYLPNREDFPIGAWKSGTVFGCVYPDNIRAMPEHEAEQLSAARFYLVVYEVPSHEVFHGESGRQVIFRKTCARVVRRLCLNTFVDQRKEVAVV